MAESGGHLLGSALCEVFGLPADRVSRLSLDVDTNDVVRVNVELLPDSNELRNAARVLASFKFKVEP